MKDSMVVVITMMVSSILLASGIIMIDSHSYHYKFTLFSFVILLTPVVAFFYSENAFDSYRDFLVLVLYGFSIWLFTPFFALLLSVLYDFILSYFMREQVFNKYIMIILWSLHGMSTLLAVVVIIDENNETNNKRKQKTIEKEEEDCKRKEVEDYFTRMQELENREAAIGRGQARALREIARVHRELSLQENMDALRMSELLNKISERNQMKMLEFICQLEQLKNQQNRK